MLSAIVHHRSDSCIIVGIIFINTIIIIGTAINFVIFITVIIVILWLSLR